MTDAPDLMRKAIETFEARSSYGPADFKKQGEVMQALFPEGMQTLTVEQCSRFVVLSIIVTKLCRYAEHAHDNGHDDSIHDIGVYAFILQAMDIASRDGLAERPPDIAAFRDAVHGVDPKSGRAARAAKEPTPAPTNLEIGVQLLNVEGAAAETAPRAELPDYAIDRWVEIPATDDTPLRWEGLSRRGVNKYVIEKVRGGWRYHGLCGVSECGADLEKIKRGYEGRVRMHGARPKE